MSRPVLSTLPFARFRRGRYLHAMLRVAAQSNAAPAEFRAVWPYRLAACALILVASILHVAYLLCDPPLDLAPDEAHYWAWSRHLDWSYYSKGPLVAWLIRASCELLGPLSRSLTGGDAFAVRAPAVACGAGLLAGLYVLTVQALARERLAAAVVALALTLPMVSAGATVMTIDSPYTACWVWALVFGHRAIFHGSAWAWACAGLTVGLGILAKYTMVLWLPCVGLFLLTSPHHRDRLREPGFWLAAGLAGLCAVPVVAWNARYDWVSARHVGALAGLQDDDAIRWLGPLRFVGEQAALLLGYWFAVWLAAVVAFRPGRGETDGERYLWWTSAPVFAVFLGFSLLSPCQVNWAVTAYLSGMVLAAGWLGRRWSEAPSRGRTLLVAGAVGTAALGLGLTLAMHYPGLVRPVLAVLAGPPRRDEQLPLRRLDPTCRLRGWRTLALAADELLAELRTDDDEPLLAASNWFLPGELSFYCDGQPEAFTFGTALADRRSQYDLWHPNPIADAKAFHGRSFVFVGDATPEIRAAFDSVGPTRIVRYDEAGLPVATWKITACRGFRGFGRAPDRAEPGY